MPTVSDAQATRPAVHAMQPRRCDCTVNCGDDPDIRAGKAQPCQVLRAVIAQRDRDRALAVVPAARGVSRLADSAHSVLVHFPCVLSDAQLRALHIALGGKP